MDRQIITFKADDQVLVKLTGADLFASNIVSYIDAQFDLGNNWSGFDAVRAVWQSNTKTIATILDANGKCVVPAEMLMHPTRVLVNLVGSVVEGTALKERLTTYPVLAFTIDSNAIIHSDETPEGTPTLFEQYAGTIAELVETNVAEYISQHPEYVTTVMDNSLTTPKYQDGSITTAKIAERAITEEKLSSALKLKTIKDYVTPEMFGAKGDGETDDTAAIQECVSYACEHNLKAYFFYTYKITEKINVSSNAQLFGDNCTLICAAYDSYSDNNAFFFCENASDIVIDGFNFVSENTKTDSRSQLTSNAIGVVLKDTENVVIKNCKGDALQYFVLIPNTVSELTKGVVIEDCEITETHQPFYMSSADDIVIRNIIAGQCDDTSSLSHHVYINGKNNNIVIDDYLITKAGSKQDSYIIQLSDTNSVGYAPENVHISRMRTKNRINSGFIAVIGASDHIHYHYIDNCMILNEKSNAYGGDKQKVVERGNNYASIEFKDCIFENFTSVCMYNYSTGNLTFNNCLISYYGTTTYDFQHCSGDIHFNNCNIVYDLDTGHLLDTSIDHIKPNLYYKDCHILYIRPKTWGYVVNGSTITSFINCEFTKDGDATSTRQFTVSSGIGLMFIGCVFRKYSAFLNSQTNVVYQNNVAVETE